VGVTLATGIGGAARTAGGFGNIARYELGQKWLPQLANRAGRIERWAAKPVLERGEIILRAAKGNYLKAYLPKAAEIMKPFAPGAIKTLPTPLAASALYGGAQAVRAAMNECGCPK